jgi:hypothetical protein
MIPTAPLGSSSAGENISFGKGESMSEGLKYKFWKTVETNQ